MSTSATNKTEKAGQEHPHPDAVTVVVNNQPVKLPDKKVTGLEIKQAAIAQGLKVQVGFALFRLTGHKQHPVRDDETITVHEGEEFRCVDTDDNS